MRIIVCGHTAVHPENRRRWVKFAELYPDADLTLVVPDRWQIRRYGKLEDFRPEEEHRGNYHVAPVPVGQWRYKGYNAWRSLKPTLRALKPDILDVVENTFAPMCLQPLLYRRLYLPRTRTIATTNENQRYQFDTPIRRGLKRFVFGSVAGFSCENVEAAELLRQHGFTKPTLVQPAMGVDEEKWRPGDGTKVREKLNLSSFVVGFVGPIVFQKGVDDFIRALWLLKGEWTSLIVGDGPERDSLERLTAELGVTDQVRFAGYVPRSETPLYYRAMDVLVLPSRTMPGVAEQFGNVMTEARFCGVPVIGSDSGSIPRILGDAALIFPEGDAAALANRVQSLMDNPALHRDISMRGRQYALARYSTVALSQQKYEFYQQLLDH